MIDTRCLSGYNRGATFSWKCCTMELTPLHEYILKTQEERQAHIDLSDPCLELGADSQESRALMALHLRVFLTKQVKVHLCHACGNAKCSNPKHLYWGTPRENTLDAYMHDPDISKRSRDTRLKRNPNCYREMALKRRELNRDGAKMDPEKVQERFESIKHLNPNEWGFYKKVGEVWGVTPQTAGRFYRKYADVTQP